MKAFIVEDSATVVEKLSAMLSSIDGVEIAGRAMNADDAIRSIAALNPDLVILDICLNGKGSGIDVLESIKRGVPSPIVIVLTNHPYPVYREKCSALGADYFFDKVTEIGYLYDTFQQLGRERSAVSGTVEQARSGGGER